MEQKNKKEVIDNNIAKSVKKRPSTSKKKKKNNSVLILILGIILGLALGVMISIIIFEKAGNDSKTSTKETEQTEVKVENYMDTVLEEKGFEIETPVVNLQYPEKWKNLVKIEQSEGDFHTVQFIATIEGKDEIQLFDIVFGGEEGYTLGYLKDDNNKQVNVTIISYDFELGEDWTTEEKTSIYGMMEDVNYIIGMLQKEAGFELAK